jgi:hypothetical protein
MIPHVFVCVKLHNEFIWIVYGSFSILGLPTNVSSKPRMEVRRPWCLLSSNLVGLGNPGEGGGQRFRKRSVTDIKFISSKKYITKNCVLLFSILFFIYSNWLSVWVRRKLMRLVHWSATMAAHAHSLEGTLFPTLVIPFCWLIYR